MLKKKKETKSGSKKWSRFKNAGFLPVMLYAALAALMLHPAFFHVRPETLDFDLFSISENTIYAPATVEDQKATGKKSRPRGGG